MALIETVTDASGQTTYVNGVARLTVDGTGVTVAGTFSGGGSGGYPAGVRQVVQASLATVFNTATNIPLDNTIPQNTEGAEFLTCAITPQSTTSTLYISAVVSASNTFSNVSTVGLALFRDSGVNAIAAISIACYQGNTMITIPLNTKVASGSTAATTFRLRIGGNGNGGTTYVNGNSVTGQVYGGVSATTLTITEVGA